MWEATILPPRGALSRAPVGNHRGGQEGLSAVGRRGAATVARGCVARVRGCVARVEAEAAGWNGWVKSVGFTLSAFGKYLCESVRHSASHAVSEA